MVVLSTPSLPSLTNSFAVINVIDELSSFENLGLRYVCTCTEHYTYLASAMTRFIFEIHNFVSTTLHIIHLLRMNF